MRRCIHLADILEAQADAIGDRPAIVIDEVPRTPAGEVDHVAAKQQALSSASR